MNIKTLYDAAKNALNAVTEDASFEAMCLLEHFLGASRTDILVHGEREADFERARSLLAAVERRKNGEPLQYIIGEWDFMSLSLFCGEGVLIPRDDTAVLVETVLSRLDPKEGAKGLDLCAGTGAVGFSIAAESGAAVTAVEYFDAALAYLRKNIARYPELAVKAVQGDVLSADFAQTIPGGLDFIASNPPYIETGELPTLQKEVQKEPKTALDGGADGLLFYRAICDLWAKKLRTGGVLAVEIGETQGAAVAALFQVSRARKNRDP